MKSILKDFYLWIFNFLIPMLPFQRLRIIVYKILRLKIGNHTTMLRPIFFYNPYSISIGDNCALNDHIVLDGRGNLKIGNRVNISPYVKIYTAEHSINSETFEYISDSVHIDDYVWISTGAMIMPGVKIGKGAVIAAGSVVTKNVEPFSIMGGIPAKKIGIRSDLLNYKPNFTKYFH